MSDAYLSKGQRFRMRVLNKLIQRKEATDPFVSKEFKPNPYVEMVLQDVLALLKQQADPKFNHTAQDLRVLNLPGVDRLDSKQTSN
jgi:hypothetical protein